jgi:predicted GNAT superfamily acetyltransferase
MSMTLPNLTIRHCDTLDELKACVMLQKEVWNFTDLELVPLRLFVVAKKIGGQVIGAFNGRELAGFNMSLPGLRDGGMYLHSHMLAVGQAYRNAGVGRQLKLVQREDALQRGINLIEWTFDPLEIKNAWLNIERLGVIVRRYVVNQYGITSSPLQGGLPSDRFVAEWWLNSRRVQTTLKDGKHLPVAVERMVSVPAEIYEWKSDPAMRARAAEVQMQNRELLMRAFEDGLAVVGYERDAHGNGMFLLGRLDEQCECDG